MNQLNKSIKKLREYTDTNLSEDIKIVLDKFNEMKEELIKLDKKLKDLETKYSKMSSLNTTLHKKNIILKCQEIPYLQGMLKGYEKRIEELKEEKDGKIQDM